MGYDMEVREPGRERPRLPKRNDNGEMDAEDVQRYVAERDAWANDGNYFRANIWAMSVLRDVLSKYALLTERGHPSWPRGDEDTTAVRAQRAPTDTAVGAWKFCSNDGWIVTPDECLILSQGIDEALNEADFERVLAAALSGRDDKADQWEQYIARFGEFCWSAAMRGGFEVW